MTLRNHFSVRTLTLSLLLAAPLVGTACWEPKLKDAEIGCGVSADASPKCPNHPKVEAGPATPDGAGDVGPDGGPAVPDAEAKTDTAPAVADADATLD